MHISYPHIIENGSGEKIVFLGVEREPDGDKVYGESFVTPGNGPLMHTHWKQDEGFTVLKGKLAYQVLGEPVKHAAEGDSVFFKRGVPHRFWNEGEEMLHCEAWVKPANTFVFFITNIFAAQKKTGGPKPEPFDAAYLLTRYSSEYKMQGIPVFVRKVIIPITYFIGKLTGKYKKFHNAPTPLK